MDVGPVHIEKKKSSELQSTRIPFLFIEIKIRDVFDIIRNVSQYDISQAVNL